MARKPYTSRRRAPAAAPATAPAAEPSPELARILGDLQSPNPATRAQAVRALCPCRGTPWEEPVFQRVFAMRNDPSPEVRHAVEHDLKENPAWGERAEARRMEARRARLEMQSVREAIETGRENPAPPGAHSLAWRAPRRPRSRKGYYPRGR
jgi:hypothetical protein